MKNFIIFDLSQAQPQRYVKYHGGGLYAYKFFVWLLNKLQLSGQTSRLLVTVNKDKQLNPEVNNLLEDRTIQIVSVGSIDNIVSTIIKHDSLDTTIILPIPYKILPRLKKDLKSKLIITMHSLRDVQSLKNFSLAWYKFPNLLKMCYWCINSVFLKNKENSYFNILKKIAPKDIVLVDSYFSKKQVEKFICKTDGISEQNLKVIYPLIPEKRRFKNIVNKVNYPFFLSVSASRPIKNCLRVLEAINRFDLFKTFPDWRYVLTGVNSNLESLIKYKYRKLLPNLILYGYISAENLHELYTQSKFTVFPSLDEGFGYPVAESYAYAKSLACSNATCLPEVAANGAIYFHPKKLNEIFNALKILISDRQSREKLEKNAINRYIELKNMASQGWEQFYKEII